jgi:hypothetical protein
MSPVATQPPGGNVCAVSSGDLPVAGGRTGAAELELTVLAGRGTGTAEADDEADDEPVYGEQLRQLSRGQEETNARVRSIEGQVSEVKELLVCALDR